MIEATIRPLTMPVMAQATTTAPQPRGYHHRGIDAVRGMGVIIGLLYHSNQAVFRSGFFFVDIFGVISGYFITRMLLAERELTGAISFKRFYLRRARRLLPALFMMLTAVTLYARAFEPQILHDLRSEVLAALGYVYNWFAVFAGGNYFSNFKMMPLEHLWSLAVEEQFYILWPAALLVLLYLFRNRRQLLPWLLLLFAALCAVFAMVVYLPTAGTPAGRLGQSTSVLFGHEINTFLFVYMNTISRAGGFLVGCALAFWWRPEELDDRPARFNRIVDVAGLLGLASVAAATNLQLFTDDVFTLSVIAQVGVWAACVALLCAFSRPQSRMTNAVLTHRPIVRLGVLIYGMYLFHWPVIEFYRRYPFKTVPWPVLGVATIGIYLAAEASMRWFERPIRRLGFKGWLAAMSRPVRAAVVCTGTVAVLTAGASLVFAPPATPVLPVSLEPSVEVPSNEAVARRALGDSIMLGNIDELQELDIVVTAATMQSYLDGVEIVKHMMRNGLVTDTLVVHLGSGEPLSPEDLTELLDTTRSLRRVVLLTLYRGGWDQAQRNNEVIRSMVDRYPNLVVADWHAVVEANPSAIFADEIHVSVSGRPLYAGLVRRAIEAPEGGTVVS